MGIREREEFGLAPEIANTVASFLDYTKRLQHFKEMLELMEWDMSTGAPKQGLGLRAEAIGTLADHYFSLHTGSQMGEFLDTLSESAVQTTLSPQVHRLVALERESYERHRKIPQARNMAYEVLKAESRAAWGQAKSQSDFALFQPYLERIVEMKREFVTYWGFAGHPYNALMHDFEPGLTVTIVDGLFADLRRGTVDLLQQIAHSGKSLGPELLRGTFPKATQRELGVYLLKQMGYDFDAGRLDESLHPFETALNRYDVRVTTSYNEHNLASSVTSTIHEGGHALYEQGIHPQLIGSSLCAGASFGIHESQSRFWENMIGLSAEYWEAYFPKVQELFPQFAAVSARDFQRALNHVQPSLIRVEADELTYNLHIMVRYELEKDLIGGTIEVRDLPELWRNKMQELLGVVPDTDATGVLQDIHWSDGAFGYFPAYSMGNFYSAQFRHQLQQDIPDHMEQVRQGNLLGVKAWLNDKIHQHGRMLDPLDLVQSVTGETLNARYLLDYLREKFAALYNL